MAAYIDREATVESLNALKLFLRDKGQVQLLRRVMNHIGKIPAADVVHVVRCKDCRFNYGLMHDAYNPQDVLCEYWATDGLHEDDFCSYGERKEADGNG